MGEPVFIRSRWGTNRYVYNPHSPVGLALILLPFLVAAGVFLWLHDDGEWSDDELRTAVHEAAARLEAGPRIVDASRGLAPAIGDAIERTGEGPSFGARVSREGRSDHYTVTGEGTDAAFCLRVTTVPVDESYAHLTVEVTDGACSRY
ncbi:hypothetical protein ABZ918_27360 [Streptomyces viridosporus]|uniref:hypothetical protein n=1 Tax=Streptomyces viridosporus TaxID=67581 RepID=UPI00341D6C1A